MQPTEIDSIDSLTPIIIIINSPHKNVHMLLEPIARQFISDQRCSIYHKEERKLHGFHT